MLDLSYLAIPLFQRALFVALTLAVLLALFGVLVTARGLSFLGDGLSHAAFGGIALGLFLKVQHPLAIAIPFTAVIAVSIGALRRKTGVRVEVAMATLFALCFSVGVILIHKAPRTSSTFFDPEQLLFGNILLVGSEDVWVVSGMSVFTALFLAWGWTRLAYATFDEELARLDGVEVGHLENVLLALLAAVIVASIRLAGVVLVGAFLVIPAATGRLLGKSFGRVAWLAIGAGILGVLIGFPVAHTAETPEGATIVCVLGILFFAAALVRRGPQLFRRS